MRDYKTNFENAVEYGLSKGRMEWWKILILGFLGSVYVGIAYSGYIKIAAMFITTEATNTWDIHFAPGGLIAASMIFPVGLLMIVFLGGSLFTSDNLSMIGYFMRQTKLRTIARKWVLVMLANLIGGFFIAYIMYWANTFNQRDQQVIAWLVHKKVADDWYAILFSAFVSNILVAGTIWASLATTQSIGKIFIIWFPITLFAITGFHHVVANAIVFSMAIAYGNPMTELIGLGNNWVTISIYNNLLPALIGNWVSGALFLPALYFLLIKYKPKSHTLLGTVEIWLGIGDSHGYCLDCKTEEEKIGLHIAQVHKNKSRLGKLFKIYKFEKNKYPKERKKTDENSVKISPSIDEDNEN